MSHRRAATAAARAVAAFAPRAAIARCCLRALIARSFCGILKKLEAAVMFHEVANGSADRCIETVWKRRMVEHRTPKDPTGRLQSEPPSQEVLMSTDTGTTLQQFALDDLAVYTAEQAFGPTASPDFRVFYVGRDDVHGVLMHLFTRVSLSVKMNMFGYDDDALNNVLIGLVRNPAVLVQVTLDKSQASGPTEKTILTSDEAQDAEGFANDFAVGESATAQISHTKGGVLDGIVAFEGSTNWSSSGEGTGINLTTAKQAPGFKAQNNTLAVYVNAYEIAKFAARLDYEHAVAASHPQPTFSAAAP
jgi:hypothetical protein